MRVWQTIRGVFGRGAREKRKKEAAGGHDWEPGLCSRIVSYEFGDDLGMTSRMRFPWGPASGGTAPTGPPPPDASRP